MSTGIVSQLEENPYWFALHSKHAKIFKLAELRQYTFLVPCNSSLEGMGSFSSSFCESHIFKKYGSANDQYYESMNGKILGLVSDEVAISKPVDGGPAEYQVSSMTVYPLQGYDDTEPVKVIAEEEFYTADFKPYRVLLIERPLDEAKRQKGAVSNNDAMHLRSMLPNDMHYVSIKLFFDGIPDNRPIVIAVGEFGQWFRLNFNIERSAVPEIVTLVDSNVQTLYNKAITESKLLSIATQSNKLAEDVKLMIHRLRMSLRSMYGHEDRDFSNVLSDLIDATPADIGVPPSFHFPYSFACETLTLLSSKCVTPSDILLELQIIFDSITKEIRHWYGADAEQTRMSDIAVTTDDLIPIVAYIIAKTHPNHAISDLVYAETFCPPQLSTSQLGFNLITYRAGIEFLRSPSMRQIGHKIAHGLDRVQHVVVKDDSAKIVENKKPEVKTTTPNMHVPPSNNKTVGKPDNNNKSTVQAQPQPQVSASRAPDVIWNEQNVRGPSLGRKNRIFIQ